MPSYHVTVVLAGDIEAESSENAEALAEDDLGRLDVVDVEVEPDDDDVAGGGAAEATGGHDA